LPYNPAVPVIYRGLLPLSFGPDASRKESSFYLPVLGVGVIEPVALRLAHLVEGR
jgi:hypothetical protein